VLKPERT